MARIIDSSNKNLIGQKVKELRKEKKMSQQRFQTSWKHWQSISAVAPSPVLRTVAAQSRISNYSDYHRYLLPLLRIFFRKNKKTL